jgi:hypothetical protein
MGSLRQADGFVQGTSQPHQRDHAGADGDADHGEQALHMSVGRVH